MTATSPGPEAADVAERLAALRSRIAAAGGDPGVVTVVAVTKTFPVDVVRAAVGAGLFELGESYAQELEAKAEELSDDRVRWHFIGNLQRNKVRRVASVVGLWQSVDRLEVGREIARRQPGGKVLIQVNTTGEATKGGCPPQTVAPLADELTRLGLVVRGLMTVGPTDGSIDPRPAFAALRSLVDRLDLEVCSMGMSGDLDAAVREGSTMIRVGTALFGVRSGRGAAEGTVG